MPFKHVLLKECQRVLGGYELNAAKFTPDGLKVPWTWHTVLAKQKS